MSSLRNKGRGGPKTPAGRARALANLKPCKPGETHNPAGRPSAGMSIKEWINQMQDWPESKVKAVGDDESQPMNKRAAARVWVNATSKFTTSAGAPISGPYFDRVCDRTEGKPTQPVNVQDVTPPTTVGDTGLDYSLLTDEQLEVLETIADQVAERQANN